MKDVEEFSVNGKYDESPIKGKATVYTNNLKKAKRKGSKNSVLKSKVGAAIIIASLAIGGIVGNDTAYLKQAHHVEYRDPNYENFDVRLDYTVKKGDTLWKIISRYTQDEKIKSEVEKIAALNNLEDINAISEGMNLKIDVPIQSTQLFPDEYYEFIWASKIMFFKKAFDIPIEKVHPDNKYFWTAKEEVYRIIEDSYIARADLNEMMNQRDVYGDVRIREQQLLIDLMYEQAITRTESAVGVNYYNTNSMEEYNLERISKENSNTKVK